MISMNPFTQLISDSTFPLTITQNQSFGQLYIERSDGEGEVRIPSQFVQEFLAESGFPESVGNYLKEGGKYVVTGDEGAQVWDLAEGYGG